MPAGQIVPDNRPRNPGKARYTRNSAASHSVAAARARPSRRRLRQPSPTAITARLPLAAMFSATTELPFPSLRGDNRVSRLRCLAAPAAALGLRANPRNLRLGSSRKETETQITQMIAEIDLPTPNRYSPRFRPSHNGNGASPLCRGRGWPKTAVTRWPSITGITDSLAARTVDPGPSITAISAAGAKRRRVAGPSPTAITVIRRHGFFSALLTLA
jgi:hypothetical protein